MVLTNTHTIIRHHSRRSRFLKRRTNGDAGSIKKAYASTSGITNLEIATLRVSIDKINH
jgi:hypothetical protein